MSWVIYALLAAIATAIVSILDKLVLSKWMVKASGSFFIFGVVEALAGIVTISILGFPALPFPQLLLTLATGAALAGSALCYFKAVKVEEVSRVVPLFNLSSLFVAVFAAVFLGEFFSPAKYIGVALLVLGALLLTLRRFADVHVNEGFWWMMLAVTLISAGAVTSKYLLDTADPWTIFAYAKFGTLFISVPFMREGSRVFLSAVRQHGRRVWMLGGISEVLTSATSIFFLFAASTSAITLVSALVGTHPLFLLLFTILFSVYHPSILKEELGREILARKAIGIACMFLGVWLVM